MDNNKEKEFDLAELVNIFLNFIKLCFFKLLDVFDYVARLFVRNIFAVILIFMLSLFLIVGFKTFIAPRYTNTLIIRSNTSSSHELINEINNWCTSSRYNSLNYKDIVDPLYLRDINFDGEWDVVEKKAANLSTDSVYVKQFDENTIAVKIDLYDSIIVNDLKTKMFSFLNCSEGKLGIVHKNVLLYEKERIERYEKEIALLDSMQNAEYVNIEIPNVNNMMFKADGRLKKYYEAKLEILDKKHEAELNLILWDKPVSLVKDVIEEEKGYDGFLDRFKDNILLMLIVTFVLVVILDNRKDVWKYLADARKK